MDAEKIARTIVTGALITVTHTDLTESIATALRDAYLAGYQSAREQALGTALKEGVTPETNTYAEWYRHGWRILFRL